jgi:hypothetical protein
VEIDLAALHLAIIVAYSSGAILSETADDEPFCLGNPTDDHQGSPVHQQSPHRP